LRRAAPARSLGPVAGEVVGFVAGLRDRRGLPAVRRVRAVRASGLDRAGGGGEQRHPGLGAGARPAQAASRRYAKARGFRRSYEESALVGTAEAATASAAASHQLPTHPHRAMLSARPAETAPMPHPSPLALLLACTLLAACN